MRQYSSPTMLAFFDVSVQDPTQAQFFAMLNSCNRWSDNS